MADRFILSHIQRLPMFARCTDDQLAAFADAFVERNFRPGEVLYTQGEDSHAMYVFVSGSGQLYRNNQPQGTIAPGQYVGESSLFNHAARDATVMANADCSIIYITRDALIQAVNARPELRSVLNERPEWIDSLPGAPLSTVSTSRGAIVPATNAAAYPPAPYPAAQYPQVPQSGFTSQAAYPDPNAPPGQPYPTQYPAQTPQYPPQAYQSPIAVSNPPNEMVLLHTRRHLWTVGGKTFGAMIVIAISLSAIVLASQSPAGLRNTIDAFGGLAAVVSGFMVAFWLVEWFGDTFSVTTNRIVHNVRVFPSGAETREQVLLTSVQSVDVTRSGYLADILGFGDILIAVAGTRQPMVLDHIPHPLIAQKLILQQVERAGVDPALLQSNGALPPPIVGGIPQYSAPIRTNGRFWPHTREVIGDRIIYRKHWGVLIGYELRPLLSYVLWMLFLTLRSTATGNLAAAFSLSILDTLSAAWVILTTFWVIWEYLRWYNDLYILDSETVVDIVRQPFGLREVRIQAGLPQIQNVTSEVHSLWGTFFNFGDVLIQTAAQQGQMVFYGVHNPTGVADEILQHVRDYGANRITQEQSMNRDAFSEALAGYRPGFPQPQSPGYPQQQPYVQQPYPQQQPYEVPPPNAAQYPPANAAQYPPTPTQQPTNVRYPRVPPQTYNPRNGPQR